MRNYTHTQNYRGHMTNDWNRKLPKTARSFLWFPPVFTILLLTQVKKMKCKAKNKITMKSKLHKQDLCILPRWMTESWKYSFSTDTGFLCLFKWKQSLPQLWPFLFLREKLGSKSYNLYCKFPELVKAGKKSHLVFIAAAYKCWGSKQAKKITPVIKGLLLLHCC